MKHGKQCVRRLAISLFAFPAVIYLGLAPSFASESVPEQGDPIRDNPGSIIDQLQRDAEEKDFLFEFPGSSGLRKSWRGWKAELNEKYGFKFLAQLTSLYQSSSDTALFIQAVSPMVRMIRSSANSGSNRDFGTSGAIGWVKFFRSPRMIFSRSRTIGQSSSIRTTS